MKIYKTMIRIYGMPSCPDCVHAEEQVKGNDSYDIVDIGKDVRTLKAFLKLRDSSSVFDEARRTGAVGIPCFVLEDGTVTLSPEYAGLEPRTSPAEGASCSLDGSGC